MNDSAYAQCAIALTLTLATAGPALAQNQASGKVEVYGRIDIFAGSEKENAGSVGAASVKVLGSGGLSGSRLGIRGSEDLGGGLRAVFTLEQGFNADVGTLGQGGRAWGRRAIVGLAGSFGQFDLGRRESAYWDFRNDFVAVTATTDFDPVGAVFGETNPANVSVSKGVKTSSTSTSTSIANTSIDGASASASGDYLSRLDNVLRYSSPRWGGFQFAVDHSLGEDKRVVGGAQGNAGYVTGLSATYKRGALDAGLAYQQQKFRSSITAAGVVQGQARKSVAALGLSYDFGLLTVAALANLDEFTAANGTREKAKEFALGIGVPVGLVTLNAMVARGRIDGVANSASGWGVQAIYRMSKRTELYVAHRTNKDDNTATSTRSAQVKDSLTGVGMRHRF